MQLEQILSTSSHKYSVGVFSNQTVDIVLSDFETLFNILKYKAADLIH
jgi:hypothetical protein